MKLFLISQPEDANDIYNVAVVIAADEEAARLLKPGAPGATVRLLGIAAEDVHAGILLSFNAG